MTTMSTELTEKERTDIRVPVERYGADEGTVTEVYLGITDPILK